VFDPRPNRPAARFCSIVARISSRPFRVMAPPAITMTMSSVRQSAYSSIVPTSVASAKRASRFRMASSSSVVVTGLLRVFERVVADRGRLRSGTAFYSDRRP
jgi:hypothetical protein